jgi:dihydrofolate reductase
MRRLTYYVAVTSDGFIAHTDGSVEGFLMEGEHVQDFMESLSVYDTVLMGRATYDFGRSFGVTNPYPTLRQYVFSRTLREPPDPAINLVSHDVVSCVRELKAEATGKDIWLCGGADLAAELFAEELIDELILKVNPIVFGAGKALFARAVPPCSLQLTGNKVYANGVVMLRYRVQRDAR